MIESPLPRRPWGHKSASLVFVLFKLRLKGQPAKGPPQKYGDSGSSCSTSPALWNKPGTKSPKQAAVSPPIAKSLQRGKHAESNAGAASFPKGPSKVHPGVGPEQAPAFTFRGHGLCQLTQGLGHACMVGITSTSKRHILGSPATLAAFPLQTHLFWARPVTLPWGM